MSTRRCRRWRPGQALAGRTRRPAAQPAPRPCLLACHRLRLSAIFCTRSSVRGLIRQRMRQLLLTQLRHLSKGGGDRHHPLCAPPRRRAPATGWPPPTPRHPAAPADDCGEGGGCCPACSGRPACPAAPAAGLEGADCGRAAQALERVTHHGCQSHAGRAQRVQQGEGEASHAVHPRVPHRRGDGEGGGGQPGSRSAG